MKSVLSNKCAGLGAVSNKIGVLFWFLNENINNLFSVEKTTLMPNYWPTRSGLRWMSVVRNREIQNMMLRSTFGLPLHVFCFGLLSKFDVRMIGKKLPFYLFVYTNRKFKLYQDFSSINYSMNNNRKSKSVCRSLTKSKTRLCSVVFQKYYRWRKCLSHAFHLYWVLHIKNIEVKI